MSASIFPVSKDYTDKDFDSIRLRVQALIKSVFPTWTDLETTNFGNILVDNFAWMMDVLCFTQDSQALESRIATVTQRRNLLALVKLLAYRPPGASAATAEVTFTGIGLSANTTVPTATVVRTQSDSPEEFQLLSALTLTPGAPTAIGTVEHSKTFEESFTASGQPGQKVAAGQLPYLGGSSTITDGSGLFTEVDNFLDSGSADRHVVIEVDNNERAIATFGDGINGQLPTGTITWDYRTGGGITGNVEAGSINKLDTTLVDVLSNAVTVNVSNATAATGGADREAASVTKLKAPASIRAVRTTISSRDHEDRALEIAGVTRALMLTTREDPEIQLDRGFLYVVPTGTGFSTAVLRQKVKDRCRKTFPGSPTFDLSVEQPIYLDVGVTARVAFAKGVDTAAKKSVVKVAIIESLRAFFSPILADGTPNSAIGFGANVVRADGTVAGSLALSDIFNAVRDTAGIRKVGPLTTDLTVSATRRRFGLPDVVVLAPGSHADVPMQLRDFPRLDGQIDDSPAVVIVDADSGLIVS